MRDRLIELISDVQYMGGLEEKLADHLLASGVIVPNVAIGTKIYAVPLYPRGVYEFEVADISVELIDGTHLFSYVCYGGWTFNDTHLGKTVFLTREEAEKALAEKKG